MAALALVPRVARASGGLDVDHPEVDHVMRVSLGSGRAEAPRQIDAYTFTFGARTYRGTFAIVPLPDGESVVVNTLPLDAYLYGVVSHEVSAGWPRAALQAQAIAARTYAFLRRRPGEPYDVVASTSDQFYGGVDVEEVPVRDAVDSTSGEFVMWSGAPAHVLYSSCCGGFTAGADAVRFPGPPVEVALSQLGASETAVVTEPIPTASPQAASIVVSRLHDTSVPIEPTAADIQQEMTHAGGRVFVPPVSAPPPASSGAPFSTPPDRGAPVVVPLDQPARAAASLALYPYLTERPDPHCTEAPGYRWHHELGFDLARYFGADVASRAGDIRSIEMRETDPSGRPRVLRMIGTRAAYDIDSADFRRRFGASIVRSTRLSSVDCDGKTLALAGQGFGHGVGMCQWGARGMATDGAAAADILAFYFPGTVIGSV